MDHFDQRPRNPPCIFVVDVRAYIERCLRFPRGATPQPPRHFAKSTAKFPNRRPGNPRPNPHPPLSLSLQINRDAGGRIVDQILALPKLWPLPFKRVSALDRSTLSTVDFSKAFFLRSRVPDTVFHGVEKISRRVTATPSKLGTLVIILRALGLLSM